jgi:hypothetical protein
MGSEQSGNPEMAVLKCGLGGAALIALVGGLGAWMIFVVGDRMRKTDAARHLQGAWTIGDGAEFRFDFSSGHHGTIEAWSTDTQFTDRVRVIWRRSSEVVIGIGPDDRHEDYFLVRFMEDPNTVVMRPEGEDTEPVVLMRQRHPPARRPDSAR